MEGARKSKTVLIYIGILLTLFLLINGCAHFTKGSEDEGMKPQDTGFAPPIYYDFGDVRLPEELRVDNTASFVYRTAGFSAGVLVLEGRVELYSLIGFFEKNMATENWKFISSFKSPRTIMLFQKETRWCVINITEGKLKTVVEIWVAPTMDGAGYDQMR
jgi:hypothetical protein